MFRLLRWTKMSRRFGDCILNRIFALGRAGAGRALRFASGGWASSRDARRSTSGRLAEDRRGIAAVEFALAATPLLFIAFGFFGINLMFYTLSTMQSAAQYSVMLLATGNATLKNGSSGTTIVSGTTYKTFTGTVISCSSNPTSPSPEYFACTDPALPTWATFSVVANEDCSVPKVSVTISLAQATEAAMAGDAVSTNGQCTSTGGVMSFGNLFCSFTGQSLSTTAVAMKQGSCP